MVDVGGSHESRSIALAERVPSLHCVAPVVLDIPEVVADGLSKTCPDLGSRVTIAAHSFFTKPSEIAKRADV